MATDKRIEDYLHLYLGCEIYYPETKETNTVSWTHLLDVWSTQERGDKWNPLFVLSLRKLSDMSEEERVEQDYLINLKFAANYRKEDSRVHEARITKYLLSKHFDLFGLIESGLAMYLNG